jgi:signal transduction histidine kinase
MSVDLKQKIDTLINSGDADALFLELKEITESFPLESIELNKQVLKHAVNNCDKLSEAKCLLNISSAYYYMGDYKQSLSYANKATDYFRELGEKKHVAASLSSKGRVFIDLGDYNDALGYQLEALRILEELNDKKGISTVLNNIGIIYWNCEDYTKAIENFEKSLELKRVFNDKKGIARTFNNIGNVHKTQENFDTSLKYYNDALKINKEIGNVRGISFCLNNIGTIYNDLNEYDKAIDYFNKANELKIKSGDKPGMGNSFLNLGIAYKKKGDYEKALQYLNKGMEIAKEENVKPLKKKLYYIYAELFEIQDEYKKSLENFKLYIEIKDALFNEEVLKKFTELQLRYEIEKTEKENELLRQRNEIQKLELETQKNLKELNETKDKFFSIIAHDLKSPFAVMSSFLNILKKTNKYDKDTVMDLVDEMDKTVIASMDLLENLLEWSRTQTGRIEFAPRKLNLKPVLTEVLNLLKGNAVSKNITLKNEIDSSHTVFADRNMLNTIFRNLVSNAIKFSYQDGDITISSIDKSSEMEICIHDNGTGIEPEQSENIFSISTKSKTLGTAGEKGTGIGLMLCKEFVERNGGKIWVDSSPGNGSTFCFTLPKPD